MAYETGWVPIVPTELGSSIEQKFDTAFNNIDVALTAYNITKQLAEDNQQGVSDNGTTLANHESRVTALEQTGLMQYEVTKLPSTKTITEDTFQEVVRVTIATLNTGVFEYKATARCSMNTTSSSVVFQYALIYNDDPSPTWYDIWEETKDTSNDIPINILFPIAEAGGNKVEFALQARCESSGHEMNITFADVIIDQKR
jgi:hypothetical protein